MATEQSAESSSCASDEEDVDEGFVSNKFLLRKAKVPIKFSNNEEKGNEKVKLLFAI